jgi:diguanylate cyclase (GGDEF)-like protein
VGSLKENKGQTPEILQQLNQMKEQVQRLSKENLPQAIQVCEEAIRIARLHATGNPAYETELANFLIDLGMLNARNGNYIQTITLLFDDMPLFERLTGPYWKARALNIIAASNGYLGNYYDAVNYFLKCLEIFREIKDTRWEAAALNNIGYQYWNLGNYEWALKYLYKSLELVERLNDLTLEGDIYETLCNIRLSMKEYEKALEDGLKSLSLYRQVGDKHGEAEVLNSVGDVYLALKDQEHAFGNFKQALTISRSIGHHHEELETMLRIGEFYAHQEKYNQALEILKEAISIAETLGTKRSLYECYRSLSSAYKAAGDHKNALEAFEKFYEVYKEVFDEQESNRIESLEIMHQVETANKDAEIYRLKNVALQNEIEEREKAQDALKKLATTDPLTGLSNRRFFFEVASVEFQYAKAKRSSLALILLDIDLFKKVNDRYGHAVGDRVLVILAELMRESFRKEDVIARYGGDEFVVLLPGLDLEKARSIASRIENKIEQHSMRVENHSFTVGVSVGVAAYEGRKDSNIESILYRADMDMYGAKPVAIAHPEDTSLKKPG